MSSETMHRIVELIESSVQSRPSPIEFEMAYQARIAIDRIKFVINMPSNFRSLAAICVMPTCTCWRRWSAWNRWTVAFSCGHDLSPTRGMAPVWRHPHDCSRRDGG
jgi:hypothetical protein